MTGSELKEIIRSYGVSYAAVAYKIGATTQGIASTFNSKDVKSGIIEAVASALGVPVSELYSKDRTLPPTPTHGDTTTPETAEAPAASNDMQQVLLHLTALVTTQNKKIDDLTKQVADLSSRLAPSPVVSYVFTEPEPRQVADDSHI